VSDAIREKYKVTPSFLQGHAGDVNPGPGKPWIGKPDDSSRPVIEAFDRAMNALVKVPVKEMRCTATQFHAPLDIPRSNQDIERYRANPASCAGGEWVDPPFSKAWFEEAQKWDTRITTYPTPITAMRL